jgi:hypothetical protein
MFFLQVEVLILEKNESSMGQRSAPSKGARALLFEKRSSSTGLATQPSNDSSQRSVDSVVRQNLASAIEQHGSGRKSLSEFTVIDPVPVSGNVSLRKQFNNEEEFNATVKMSKGSEDDNSSLQVDCRSFHLFIVSTNSFIKLSGYEHAIQSSILVI